MSAENLPVQQQETITQKRADELVDFTRILMSQKEVRDQTHISGYGSRVGYAWEKVPTKNIEGIFIHATSDYNTQYYIGESDELMALKTAVEKDPIPNPRAMVSYDRGANPLERLWYRKWRYGAWLGSLATTLSAGATMTGEQLSTGEAVFDGTALVLTVFSAVKAKRQPSNDALADSIRKTLDTTIENFKNTAEVVLPSNSVHARLPQDHQLVALRPEWIELTRDYASMYVRNKQNTPKSDRKFFERYDPSVVEMSITPSYLVKAMLEHDSHPRELWHTSLRTAAQEWTELRKQLDSNWVTLAVAKQREKFTGVSDDEMQELEKLTQEREDELVEKYTESITIQLEVFIERQRLKKNEEHIEQILGKHRAALDAAIETPKNVIDHPQVHTLRTFRDILFEAAQDVDAEDENRTERLQDMTDYIANIAPLMTASDQAEQFYEGMYAKFGERLTLPDWDEVAPRFISASIDEHS